MKNYNYINYIEEDYPCHFCGWIDGEHSNGCPYGYENEERRSNDSLLIELFELLLKELRENNTAILEV